jgi:hypothetical protein
LATAWPFLSQEADVADELRAKAALLEDLLARESFYKELPAIEQTTRALEVDYHRRFEEALDARNAAYTKAFERLGETPGWADIDEEQQRRLADRLQVAGARDQAKGIGELRAETDACDGRLRTAIAELRRVIDGERIVSVSLGSYFGGGIETEEQLDAALDGVREECARLIGAGKKIIVQ